MIEIVRSQARLIWKEENAVLKIERGITGGYEDCEILKKRTTVFALYITLRMLQNFAFHQPNNIIKVLLRNGLMFIANIKVNF